MFPYLFVFPVILLLASFKQLKCGKQLAMILLVLFIGLRYNVGVDYENYQRIYENIYETLIEPLFWLINVSVDWLSLGVWGVMLLCAAIMIYFLHLTFLRTPFYVFSLFLFLMQGYDTSVNVVRQAVAMAIFIYSLRYIVERSFFRYLLLILLAASFHISALFLVPLYCVARVRIKTVLYPFIFTVVWIISQFNIFHNVLLWLIGLSPYGNYVLKGYYLNQTKVNSGLGFLFDNIVGLAVMLGAHPFFKKYPQFRVYFNIYFLYLLTKNLFFNVEIFARIVLYFQWSLFIVLPLFIVSVYNYRSRGVVTAVFCLAYMLLFYMGISNEMYKLDYKLISF